MKKVQRDAGLPTFLVEAVIRKGFQLGTAPGWQEIKPRTLKGVFWVCRHPVPFRYRGTSLPSSRVKLKAVKRGTTRVFLAGVCEACSLHVWTSVPSKATRKEKK